MDDADLMGMDAFDLSLAAYVLDSSVAEYTFDALLGVYCGRRPSESKGDADMAAIQAAAARMLAQAAGRGARRRRHEGRLLRHRPAPHRRARHHGAHRSIIDCDHLARLGASTQVELDDLSGRIYDLAGEEFNIDSPKQLSRVLFEELGLKPLKKNQRGYSTDAAVLKELAKEHELPSLVLRYRELAKIKSTYIDALPRMRGADGRVHTCFNETVTTTGRLSSSDPNLQNIPVRTDFGRQIRACFVPLAPGQKFLSADYSQIELRLLAHLSGDEHLVAAFCSGADFHASTAARVFDVPVEEVSPQLRSGRRP